MRTWSLSIVGGALLSGLLFGACSGGGGGNGGPSGVGGTTGGNSCQKLCTRAEQAGCGATDCVSKCEDALPKCDSEYRATVECLANAQMLGCVNGKASAGGDCDAEESAFSSCLLGGSGGSGGTGGGGTDGGGGTGGSTGPCDPLQASCVACGSASCDTPEACCWDTAGPACGASCTGIKSACDGNEDCAGGQCCVSFLIGSDGTASSGAAVCSPGGGSVCCTAQGGPGCAADKAVETCVCAQDDYCCTTDWDPQCAAEVEQFGCAACGEGCELGNASTGSGSSIKSVSCRTGADCAGVTGQFGVAYSECCRSTNFDVGACVSQTYAGSITDSGGTCD